MCKNVYKNVGKCVSISSNISDSLCLQIQDLERNTVMWRESTNTVASENSPYVFFSLKCTLDKILGALQSYCSFFTPAEGSKVLP